MYDGPSVTVQAPAAVPKSSLDQIIQLNGSKKAENKMSAGLSGKRC